jgi:magnesium-transporting ATPase (P-type)
MAATSVGDTRRGLRWGGIAGIVFAVLFVVGFLFVADTPEGDESNAEWVRHFADSDNRRMIIIGVIVWALAVLAFLVFLGVLRERLRSASPGAEWISTVAFASGLVFVAMLAAAGLGAGSVAASVEFSDAPVPRDADVLRTFDSLGFGALLLFGSATAGLLIITTSVVGGRAGFLPRWLVVTGYVAGVIVLLGGLFFIPLALFVLWMIAVGIVLLRSPGAAV